MYFTVPSIQCCKIYIFIHLPKFLYWLYHVLSLYYPGGYLSSENNTVVVITTFIRSL